MLILKSLRFFSPDGGEGGGNGGGDGGGNGDGDGKGGEPSAAQKYKTALAAGAGQDGDGDGDGKSGDGDGKGGDDAGGDKKKKAKGDDGDGKSGDGDGKGKDGDGDGKGGDKPSKAIDAALGGDGDGDGKGGDDKKKKDAGDGAVDLSQFPETLPKEGRGEHWTKARAAIESQGKKIGEYVTTVADLTKQLEEAKAAPPDATAQIAALQTQLDSYKDAIVAINLEYDPEHRAKFIDGRKTLVEQAASKLKAYGGDGEKLTEALKLPEGKARAEAIKAALGDIEGVNANRILSFVTKIDELDDERAELMKDPQGAWEKLQQAQKAAQAKEATAREEHKKTVFEAATKKLAPTLVLLKPMDASVPDSKEWNARAETVKAEALALLGPDVKPEELAEASIWAKAGPHLQTLLTETYKELKVALGLVKKYQNSEPGFEGGKGPKGGEEEKSVAKRYHTALGKLQGEEQ